MLRARVSAPVRPTEDAEKVRRALLNLFPDLRVEVIADELVGETESLDAFRDLVRSQRIRDTVRGVLLKEREDNRTRIRLSKQAACMGRVNVGADSPLGDIRVDIESDDLAAVIDYVAESSSARNPTTSGRSERT